MKPYVIHRSQNGQAMVSMRPEPPYTVGRPLGFIRKEDDGRYSARANVGGKIQITPDRDFVTRDSAAWALYARRNEGR